MTLRTGLSVLGQDARYGLRLLRKDPGFSVVAILTLALGIGANAAVFTVLNSVLLRPLDYDHPERLVAISESNLKRGWTDFGVSAPDFLDWRGQAHSFEQLAAFNSTGANLATEDTAERITYSNISANLFSVLGVKPLLGRTLFEEENTAGKDQVAILSYGFWQRQMGGTNDAIGKTVLLNGVPHVVVGVMPPHVDFPDNATELWKPLVMHDEHRGARYLEVVGRLRPEASLAAAQSEMEAISGRLAVQYPEVDRDWKAHLQSLQTSNNGPVRTPLLIFWASVNCVLLIACANVANLQLAKSSSRAAEIAMRAALGARPIRILSQLLTESVVLAVAGGIVGLLFAMGILQAFKSVVPADLLGGRAIHMDSWVLLYSVGLCLVTGIAFGLAPGMYARRFGAGNPFQAGARVSIGSLRTRVLHSVLAGGELGLALCLLIATGLLARSLYSMVRVDPGFNPKGLTTFRIAPPQVKPSAGMSKDQFLQRYLAERARSASFYRQLLGRIQATPGVKAAGAINRLPLTGNWWVVDFNIEGRPPSSDSDALTVQGRAVTAGYLEAMGVPLVRGRTFADSDDDRGQQVVVIDQTTAERYWPNEDPIGKRVIVDEAVSTGRWCTVIGIVGAVKPKTLTANAAPTVYLPLAQARFGFSNDWGMSIVVRSETASAAMTSTIANVVQSLDKSLPLYSIATGDDLLAKTMAEQRLASIVLGAFAGISLLLALVGTHGVISYSVRQRTRELGVRVALGATRMDVLRLVLAQGARLVVCGLLLGIGLAFATTRFLSTMLYSVKSVDPATFTVVSLLLAGSALVAIYFPARSATRVDPVVALRHD